MNFNEILYGVAYYDEYMPYDRIETDFKMIRDAGMNVIRIAESTWSTWEPKEGVFDFTHLHRMLCLLYTSPSPRDLSTSRMPSSA